MSKYQNYLPSFRESFWKNPLFSKKGIDFIEKSRYNVKLYEIVYKEV